MVMPFYEVPVDILEDKELLADWLGNLEWHHRIPGFVCGEEGKVSELFNRVKKGVKAVKDSFGSSLFRASGIQVVCPHCRNEVFEEGEAQLNTATASFLNLDWLNKSATVLICTQCGYIQWFGKSVEKVQKA